MDTTIETIANKRLQGGTQIRSEPEVMKANHIQQIHAVRQCAKIHYYLSMLSQVMLITIRK